VPSELGSGYPAGWHPDFSVVPLCPGLRSMPNRPTQGPGSDPVADGTPVSWEFPGSWSFNFQLLRQVRLRQCRAIVDAGFPLVGTFRHHRTITGRREDRSVTYTGNYSCYSITCLFRIATTGCGCGPRLTKVAPTTTHPQDIFANTCIFFRSRHYRADPAYDSMKTASITAPRPDMPNQSF
jgi:hypothetical protein